MEQDKNGGICCTLPEGAPKVRVQAPREGRVLLHACCAPCSSAILECLISNGIRPTVFFSNSNIVPHEEYEVRKAELIRYCDMLGIAWVDDDYDHAAWLDFALERGAGSIRSEELARMPERRERCQNCFKFRLLRAARYASDNGFSVLTTTLASSRWKDLVQVGTAGDWACAQVPGVTWWDMNWRKGGLQPRRGELIKALGFYNQLWCGCEFSEQHTEQK